MGGRRTRCPYCNAEVSSDDVFCGDCGKRLPSAPKEERRRRTPLIVGILAVVAIGCVIGGLVIVAIGGGIIPSLADSSPTPSQSEPYRPTVLPTPSPTSSPIATPAAGADEYEPDDSFGQARAIATDGTSQPHDLHIEGDDDYVYFDADEGTGYTIETLNLGSDIDSIIYLYDSDESELAYDDDGAEESLASRITWLAPSSGTYYVMIRDLGNDSAGSTATYEIRVISSDGIEGTDSYEPDDSIARASSIATDGTYQTHTFHTTADVDYVSFSAQEGVEYTIQTGDLEGNCDTLICLYDEDSTELECDDDGADESYASRLVWIAPSSGNYYVRISDFRGTAGPAVSYRTWVTR